MYFLFSPIQRQNSLLIIILTAWAMKRQCVNVELQTVVAFLGTDQRYVEVHEELDVFIYVLSAFLSYPLSKSQGQHIQLIRTIKTAAFDSRYI